VYSTAPSNRFAVDLEALIEGSVGHLSPPCVYFSHSLFLSCSLVSHLHGNLRFGYCWEFVCILIS
jgi:hypothetical protein